MKKNPVRRKFVDPWNRHKKYAYAHENWVYEELREAHHLIQNVIFSSRFLGI